MKKSFILSDETKFSLKMVLIIISGVIFVYQTRVISDANASNVRLLQVQYEEISKRLSKIESALNKALE